MKYAIVYANLFWQHRGGYACTGLSVKQAKTEAQAKAIVRKIIKETSDIVTVIDLSTGLEVDLSCE